MSKDGEYLVEAVRPLLERIAKLEEELEMYERDETFATLAIRVTELEAQNVALLEVLAHHYNREGMSEETWTRAGEAIRKAKGE